MEHCSISETEQATPNRYLLGALLLHDPKVRGIYNDRYTPCVSRFCERVIPDTNKVNIYVAPGLHPPLA
jgi:hypothetical protein